MSANLILNAKMLGIPMDYLDDMPLRFFYEVLIAYMESIPSTNNEEVERVATQQDIDELYGSK
jgi:hypothetical protein